MWGFSLWLILLWFGTLRSWPFVLLWFAATATLWPAALLRAFRLLCIGYITRGFGSTGASGFFLLFLIVVLLQVFQRYLAHIVHKAHVCGLYAAAGIACFQFHRTQLIGFFAFLVHNKDLLYAIDGERVLLIVAVVTIPHQVFEDVFFLQMRYAVGRIERFGTVGEDGEGIHVSVQLVVEATFEPAALTR